MSQRYDKGSNPHALTLNYVYMFLFSLRFSEAFWVIYLRSKGLSFAAVGLAETIFHLASLFGEIPTGWIADYFGRKTSLIAGRILSILAALLALRATGLGGFAVAFSLSALGYTCHSGAYDAMIFDGLKAAGREKSFTRVMGTINALYLAGHSVACLVGGFVAQRALPFLYILSILVDLLAILLLIPLVEIQVSEEGEERPRLSLRREIRDLAAALGQPGLAGLLFLWAAVSALETSFRFYGQSYMRQALLPLSLIGAVGMLGDLAAILPTKLVYLLENRHGRRLPLYIGGAAIPILIVLAGCASAMPALLGQTVIVICLLSVNILLEGLYPLFNNAVNVLVPSERRATVLSSGSMLFSLVMMAVFPLIGLCGDTLGLARGFVLVGGGALVLGAAAYIGAQVRARRTAAPRVGAG